MAHYNEGDRFNKRRAIANAAASRIIAINCAGCGKDTLAANGQTLCPTCHAEADPFYQAVRRDAARAWRNEVEDNSPARIHPEM